MDHASALAAQSAADLVASARAQMGLAPNTEPGSPALAAVRWRSLTQIEKVAGFARPVVRDATLRAAVVARHLLAPAPQPPHDATWREVANLARGRGSAAAFASALDGVAPGARTDDLLDAAAVATGRDRDRWLADALADAQIFPDTMHRGAVVAAVTHRAPELLLERVLAWHGDEDDDDVRESLFTQLAILLPREHLGALLRAVPDLPRGSRPLVLGDARWRIDPEDDAIWEAATAGLDADERAMASHGEARPAVPPSSGAGDLSTALRAWHDFVRLASAAEADAAVEGLGRACETFAGWAPTP